MKLIFLGPPGAGKGTVADVVGKRKGIPHISTGDIFRAAVKEGSELGKIVRKDLETGELVPDAVVNKVAQERLEEDDCKNGFILDGYPRTAQQAEAFEGMDIGVEKVINLEVDDETLLKRMLGRRLCPQCKRSYNMNTDLHPKNGETCDDDGTALITRPDDNEEVFRDRMAIYRKLTEPLIQFYEKKGLLIDVDGVGELPVIVERVMDVL